VVATQQPATHSTPRFSICPILGEVANLALASRDLDLGWRWGCDWGWGSPGS